MTQADRRTDLAANLRARLDQEIQVLADKYGTTPAAIISFAQAVLRGEIEVKPAPDQNLTGD